MTPKKGIKNNKFDAIYKPKTITKTFQNPNLWTNSLDLPKACIGPIPLSINK